MSRGASFNPDLDGGRLLSQREALLQIISDHHWYTLPELAAAVGDRLGSTCSETGISARLRELRRTKYGAHTIQKRRQTAKGGTWEYRLRPPEPTKPGNLFDIGDEGGGGTLAALR